MPTGTGDDVIFGSPDLSEFCCSNENSDKRSSLAQAEARGQIWSPTDNAALRPGAESGISCTGSHSSSAPVSEITESGDDEDILGLISSSLDRFNAQLHRSPQDSLPILVSDYAGCADTPKEMGAGSPAHIPNSAVFTWTSSAAPTPSSISHHQGRQCQDHWSLVYSSSSAASSTSQGKIFRCPSGSSSNTLQQTSIPSPPGLPRLPYRQQYPPDTSLAAKTDCLEDHLDRRQRSLSQTFSEETLSLWESHWKALPSEMSVDSGIGGETFLSLGLFANTNSTSSSNSTGDFPQVTPTTGFTPDEVCHRQPGASSRVFDVASPLFDATFKQATTPASLSADAPKGGPSDLVPSLALHPSPWPPSWSTAVDCIPAAEAPQMYFRLDGDHHQQQQKASKSRLEIALQKQQQQQHQKQRSRQVWSRRKAESICFSSTKRLNSALLPSANVPTPHSLAVSVGQLGSPPPSSLPVDLMQQPLSMPFANAPQKFSWSAVNPLARSGNGVLGPPKAFGARGGGSCRSKRTETTPSSSSSSSTSSSEASSDKPVVAKWRRACSFYLRGHCKKEDCEFAHDLTKVTCKFWEVGECFKGPTCPFLHGYPPELLLEAQQHQLSKARVQQQSG